MLSILFSMLTCHLCFFFKNLGIDFRETEDGGERNVDLLFHLSSMHSLVASCTCSDGRSNPQPCCIGTMLQPTELHSQGCISSEVRYLLSSLLHF